VVRASGLKVLFPIRTTRNLLMQYQRVYPKTDRLTSLASMHFEAGVVSSAVTVVDFVTVKSSSFNSVQQPKKIRLLNTKEFREERRVDPLVPNQIPTPIERCGVFWFVID